MRSLVVSACVVGLVTWFAPGTEATVITQWNFNSAVPDGNVNTGTDVPNIGVGTISTVGGTSHNGYFTGGPSDPAPSDNSGWSIESFPAQGTNDKTAGASFMVSTEDYFDIIVSWDQRSSNTASRYYRAQYTIDGTTWVDSDLFDHGTAGGTYAVRSIDLSSIAGVNDNPDFGFRVVSEFAPGTSTYLGTQASGNYGTAGLYRFDMVTISGTLIPEPGSLGLLGLAAGLLLRRRRAV